MKGIILAGGKGSRLAPLTHSVSKHLLPIYDKPMVYYPLSILMLANIREVLIITTPKDQQSYRELLGNGEQWGVQIAYATQEEPGGLAEAFTIGASFIGKDCVCLILGDNLFWGQGFSQQLEHAVQRVSTQGGATVFACKVKDPERFGVVTFNTERQVLSITEKPQEPASDFAVTGLYFYDPNVVTIAKGIAPSSRGEKEITSINQAYLEQASLHVELLGRGFAWMDMGTPESLFEAGQFVESIQRRRGYKIACLEEIAWLKHWIDNEALAIQAQRYTGTEYGAYLEELALTSLPSN